MNRFAFLLFTLSLLLATPACEIIFLDDCDDIDCLNGGVCINGTCDCPDGFSGPRCETPTGESGIFTGWVGDDDPNTVPVSVSSGGFGFGSGNLPASANLVPRFPPIGDQGNYGTCVTWAAGYSLKAALNAIDLNLSQAQLASPANQFSAKDHFYAIPNNLKGSNCNGTNFTPALDVVLERGIAREQIVPYTNLGNCNSSGIQSAWTADAANHKITNYRRIDKTVNSIKANIANNVPVVIGAKLADNFMTWNSSNVLSSNTTYNQVGQHAYHALIVAGYDDNRGPNGAFRVVNSWGNSWGDAGFVWVDYNFMINSFIWDTNVYTATNAGSANPPTDPPTGNDVDLVPWVFYDQSSYLSSGFINERKIGLNIYNTGTQPALPSSGWSIYYIIYDAFDVNNYGVLFYDVFSTTVPQGTFDCPPPDYACYFNYAIPGGSSFTQQVFGEDGIERTYYVPTNANGLYYLVLIADAWDDIAESDENNNFFYTTGQHPKFFNGGYSDFHDGDDPNKAFSLLKPNKKALKENLRRTAVTKGNLNAYSPEEIIGFLREKKKSGELDAKAKEYLAKYPASSYAR
jgi:hypothetical protein